MQIQENTYLKNHMFATVLVAGANFSYSHCLQISVAR